MPTSIVRKLRHGAPLSPADEAALTAAFADRLAVPAHQDLIREGDRPEFVHAVIEGLACRYKLTPDGRRQIIAWLVPGDFCDLHVAVLDRMDHSIATLVPSLIVSAPRSRVLELVATSPALSQALQWATLVDEAILREWIVGMGRRPADKQVAHLLCELAIRLSAVGQSIDGGVALPVTQLEIADTLGLSAVHVNRVLQRLRGEGMIPAGAALRVADIERLSAFAEFDPGYLHLDPRL
jgi:CRP-like cAMP-binding protein